MKHFILLLALTASNAYSSDRFKSIMYVEYSNQCNTKNYVETLITYLPKGSSCITTTGKIGKIL